MMPYYRRPLIQPLTPWFHYTQSTPIGASAQLKCSYMVCIHFTGHFHCNYPDANCQILAQAFNFLALPGNVIAQCHQQIMNYLGCGITWYIPTPNLPCVDKIDCMHSTTVMMVVSMVFYNMVSSGSRAVSAHCINTRKVQSWIHYTAIPQPTKSMIFWWHCAMVTLPRSTWRLSACARIWQLAPG